MTDLKNMVGEIENSLESLSRETAAEDKISELQDEQKFTQRNISDLKVHENVI